MSRIHEALKKAEQDRAAMLIAEKQVVSPEPMAPAPARELNSAPAAIALPPEPAPMEPAPEESTSAVITAAEPAPVEAFAAPPAIAEETPIATAPATAPVQPPAASPAQAPAPAPAMHAPPAPPAPVMVSRDFTRFEELQRCCAHPKWRHDSRYNVFLNPELSPRGAEQFRTLRSRLYQLRNSQELRTLLVTSAIPKEGKTWVATNLAQAIVRQHDRRVLIIDADLRVSRLHLPLGAPVSPGLTDYLQGKADEASIIQHGAEGNLCLIAAGKEVTNPTELLSNGRMKKLLDRLTPMIDWVILYSPPCLPVADASLLAGMCDGVLLVVRAGATRSEIARKASEGLHGRNLIGVVLNGLDEEPGGYQSYYYGAYGKSYGITEGNGSNGSNGSNGFKIPREETPGAHAPAAEPNPN
jgi:protein-tyrosine kinase